MLRLQRASAGSGKTYTLAKKFIWYLIAIKEVGKAWRLRTAREIADGLPRILAVTFTNKATNEMKQRIVDRLADLAMADGSGSIDPGQLSEIAYLKEFTSELNATPQAVGTTAKIALKQLLNNYSDFKVSTIDSFFQTILRTFAYESNLNDGYQVEIDSEAVAAAGVDSAFDHVNTSAGPSRTSYWLAELIRITGTEKKNKKWNIFQKSNDDYSIYTRLLNSLRKLENENFKLIRNELDDYFDKAEGSDPLISVYQNINREFDSIVTSRMEQIRTSVSKLNRLIAECGLDLATDFLKTESGRLMKLNKICKRKTIDSETAFKPGDFSKKKSFLQKGVSCERNDEITELVKEAYGAFLEYQELLESNTFRIWDRFKTLIPYVGLIGEVRLKMKDYLEGNNSIELGETNSMLRNIIGEDDAPFVYERMGSTINHYLIDEFQDTSRLQWENLYPLLLESESRNQENLIIGDAKQSIYRFRNADPSLITREVPRAFPEHEAAGISKEENTNWRSDRTIVEFNNFFFRRLIENLPPSANAESRTIDFNNLYSNVAQYPSHRERKGYVRVEFLENTDDTEKKTSSELAIARVPLIISELLERGYRQRDIAVLVVAKSAAKDVINALVDYNSSLPGYKTPVGFISEDSLLISQAEAVRIIVSVLEKMTEGTDLKPDNDGKDPESNKTMNWNDIRCNFSYYALSHPDLTPAQQLQGFLKEENPESMIFRMLADMQTVALPALVESVTENFVPGNLRRSQAVFIAAFQDLLLEYCEKGPNDLASFLQWWNNKGTGISITSPEGTDAVNVMTIHKAKGLEFKCVILPEADKSLKPSNNGARNEWEWVKPADYLSATGLPPYLPVELTSALKGTPMESLYNRYEDLYLMDKLNAYYVAFTRAVSELYILTGKPGKTQGNKLGSYLHSILGEEENLLSADEESRFYMLPKALMRWNNSRNILTAGELPEVETCETEKDTVSDLHIERTVEEYGVDSSPSILHYVESDDESGVEIHPEAADTDPRSEGNLLHAVMENVKIMSDLRRAVTRLRMRGLISTDKAREYEQFLKDAIIRDGVEKWFTGSWRVLCERSLIFRHSTSRPDRVMISPDGKQAVVIDYKFGAEPSGKSHIKQVRDYMADFSRASGITDIKGYVWYVRLGKIIKV